jgi:hypothetical protein
VTSFIKFAKKVQQALHGQFSTLSGQAATPPA